MDTAMVCECMLAKHDLCCPPVTDMMTIARQPCNQKHYCNGFKERLWKLYVALYLLRVINGKPESASPKFPKPPSPLTLIGRCRGYEVYIYIYVYHDCFIETGRWLPDDNTMRQNEKRQEDHRKCTSTGRAETS